jgi:hypothetical protein
MIPVSGDLRFFFFQLADSKDTQGRERIHDLRKTGLHQSRYTVGTVGRLDAP